METKTCDICHISTDDGIDLLKVGDWLVHQNVTVHYFCLLLSTHLPQEGKDTSGILGFLLRDIRKEMLHCAQRTCIYCAQSYAGVACFSCKEYFHVLCGYNHGASSHFIDDFRSYCDKCVVEPKSQKNLVQVSSNREKMVCIICQDPMGFYQPAKFIYGECCGNGFAHVICMRQYAMSAGYYLKCIWCKSGRFRNLVRKQNVFVPDRDAAWERENHAYIGIHRGHTTCDMEVCLSPRGRECDWGKWSLIICKLCGSFGAHNPICVTGDIKSTKKLKEFKCDTCKTAELAVILGGSNDEEDVANNLDKTLYVHKLDDNPVSLCLPQTPSFSGEATQDLATASAVHQEENDTELATATVEDDADIIDALLAEVKSLGILQPRPELFPTTIDPVDSRFVTFGVSEFNPDYSKCIGQCKVRIDTTSPRFVGKTIDEIQRTPGLITTGDVVERVADAGPFADIDSVIAKYSQLNKP